jgi:hypothetical protein
MSFEPWLQYPELTKDRLEHIAGIICTVRRKVVELHEPGEGDDEWSLGCRGYSRICHAFRKHAPATEWLRILPEKEKLRLTFAIGSIPIRFYHGNPSDPPSKYLNVSEAEALQRQLLFDFGIPLDTTLRIGYETAPSGEVSRIALIQMNADGDVIDTYPIPINERSNALSILPLRPKSIDLQAPSVEPLEDDGKQDQRNERDAG